MSKTYYSHIEFEISKKDKNSITLKGIIRNKKQNYLKSIEQSKLILHYFDEDEIEKLQKIEKEIVQNILHERKQKKFLNKVRKIFIQN